MDWIDTKRDVRAFPFLLRSAEEAGKQRCYLGQMEEETHIPERRGGTAPGCKAAIRASHASSGYDVI